MMSSIFKKLRWKELLFIGTIFSQLPAVAQQRVGINTTNPERTLEIRGNASEIMRIHSTTWQAEEVGLELLAGATGFSVRDWKIANMDGDFRIVTSIDNFDTPGTEVMRVKPNGFVGLGMDDPQSRLHIIGNESANNSDDGYLMMGSKVGVNLIFDNNTIVARNNGSPFPLYLQTEGNNVNLGLTSNENILVPNGAVSMGAVPVEARLNIDSDDFQIGLRNTGSNDWYIGASNPGWIAGGDQLLFSPTTSSSDAVFRLMDVTDNNGVVAPVIIRSTANHILLMDGNEIDTKTEPLFFNFNSEKETYINPSGGRVGIGTTNAQAVLHLDTDQYGLSLYKGSAEWHLSPHTNGDILFSTNTGIMALISWNGGGTWVALSDETKKTDITLLEGASDMISRIGIKRYQFKGDVEKRNEVGVIAQELLEVLPEAVFETEGQYGVSYDQLTALAIKGIQEHQQRLNKIEEGIRRVEDQQKP